jgi:hypothetical protein
MPKRFKDIPVLVAITLTLLTISSSAQTGQDADSQNGVPTSESDQEPTHLKAKDTSSQPNTPSDSDKDSQQQLPTAINIETGLPLRTTATPLRWGHLSLLSFSAFTAYDTDTLLPQVPGTAQLTVLEALGIYSLHRAHWGVDLQYEPFVWFSQGHTYTDFESSALAFNFIHQFSSKWNFTASETFRYAPDLAQSLGGAFSADFVSGTTSSTPFLANGRNFLLNGVNLGLTHLIGPNSTLTFNANADYARLSGTLLIQPTTSSSTVSEQLGYGGGVTWSHHWNSRNTINLIYDFRNQEIFELGQTTTYQRVGVGYERLLKPSLTLSLEAGPGWSTSTFIPGYRVTALGTVGLFKRFRTGGIALSASRSDAFSGVISNGYNNRFDLWANRRLGQRWNCQAGGSYIEQDYTGGVRTTKGTMGWGEVSYSITRSWSIFSGYRYFNTTGVQQLSRPQQIVSGGIHWGWEPREKRQP